MVCSGTALLYSDMLEILNLYFTFQYLGMHCMARLYPLKADRKRKPRERERVSERERERERDGKDR
jgi:hypothetical protein